MASSQLPNRVMGASRDSSPWKTLMRWVSSFGDRAILYLFPLFLVMLEMILRIAFAVDSKTFLGPTLASVGVGFVLPLTVYKGYVSGSELPPGIPEEARRVVATLPAGQFTIILTRQKRFASWCLVFTIILTGLWLGSLYFSTKLPQKAWWELEAYNWLGFIGYTIGVVLSELRERV